MQWRRRCHPGNGGGFGFEDGEDVAEVVDNSHSFHVGETCSESDADDLDAVGCWAGGKFGGHGVGRGCNVVGVAGDLGGAEVFEVEQQLCPVLVSDADESRVWGADAVGLVSQSSDVRVSGDGPAAAVVVDAPSGWGVLTWRPQQ